MPSGAGMVSGRSNQHMMGQHNPMGYSQNFQYGGGAGGVGGMNPGAGGNQVPNPNFPAGGGGAGGGMGMPGHPQQPPQYSMYPPGGNPGSHMQQHYPPGMGVQQGRWVGGRKPWIKLSCSKNQTQDLGLSASSP